jgi:hypothetical protein
MLAGLPAGMPGIGEVIEGAMQHAPQCGRQFIAACYRFDRHKASRPARIGRRYECE